MSTSLVDGDSVVHPRLDDDGTHRDISITSLSLYQKFTQLETAWSGYNKFESLKKHWSRLSNTTPTNTSLDSSRSVLTTVADDDDEPKIRWNQQDMVDEKCTNLLGFAVEEKQQLEQPPVVEEQSSLVEEGPLEPEQPEEPKISLKRRGVKRPRRLKALTGTRNWKSYSKSSQSKDDDKNKQAIATGEVVLESRSPHDNDDDDDDEQVVFESSDQSNTSTFEDEQNDQLSRRYSHLADDSLRDKESSYQDLTERVLISMSNHELWDTAKEDERYGEWQDAYQGAKTAMGIGSIAGNNNSFFEEFPLISQQERVVVFPASTRDEPVIDARPTFGNSDEREGIEEHSVRISHEESRNGFQPISTGEQREAISPEKGINDNGAEMWVQHQNSKLSFVSAITTTDASHESDSMSQHSETLKPVLRDLLRIRLCAVSALVIQRWVRSKQARQKMLRCAQERTRPNDAARRRRDLLSPKVALVRSTRKFQSADRYRKSVIVIQAAYRSWGCRRDFLELRDTVIKAQRYSRRFLQWRRQHYAVLEARRAWLNRGNASAEWSFDATGISALSFDNSYLEDVPVNLPRYPISVTCDMNDPVSALSPLPPAASLPTRLPSPLRTRPNLQLLTTVSQPALQLPPLSPSAKNRRLSTDWTTRPSRPSRVRSGLDIIKYKLKKKGPANNNREPPKVFFPPDTSTLEDTGITTQPTSKTKTKSTLSFNSPGRTTRYKCSPLASVVADAPNGADILKQRYSEKKKVLSTPTQKLSLKGKSWLRGKGGAANECKNTDSMKAEPLSVRPESSSPHFEHFPMIFKPIYRDIHFTACTSIQAIWRKYRSQLAFLALIVKSSTVVCECKNCGTLSQDRRVRQKAQVRCAAKAINQVGCEGAKERLTFGEAEVAAEWENIVHFNFELPDGRTVRTFSTIYVMSTIQRTMIMERMTKKRVFMLIIKSALMQHLSEQYQKVSRTSMLERSLTRRRAPLERDAAVMIEKCARGSNHRRRYTLKKKAVLFIQKVTRTWLAERLLRRALKSSTKIEAFFRGELVRGIVFQYWGAAIALRPYWNEYRLEKMATADALVTRIQALFRGTRARELVAQQSIFARIIQKKIRSFIAREKFMRKKRAYCFIQEWWRFWRYDRILRGLCATIIQTSYRSYRDSCDFHSLCSATIAIQRSVRGHAVRSALRSRNKAAVLIQRTIRAILVRRRMNKSSTKIQALYRGFSTESKYQQLLWSILVLQSQARKMACERRKKKREREIKAASQIQAFWRGHCARLDFLFLRDCCVAIQAIYRGHRQEILAQKAHATACIIQAWWRGYAQNFDYHIHRGATIFLQRIWRTQLAVKSEHQAVVRIQASWRRVQRSKRFRRKREMAILIQSYCRRWSQIRNLLLIDNKSLIIQRNIRGRKKRRKFLEMKRSAVKLQKLIQSWRQQRQRAATLLQAFTRKKQSQVMLNRVLVAALHIKRQWQRKLLRRRRLAAVKIQSWYRCNILFCKFVIKRFSAVSVQSAWRSFRQINEYQQTRHAVKLLQSHFRKGLVVKSKVRATVRIQCFVRQQSAKKKCSELFAQKRKNEKMLHVRARRKMRIELAQKNESAATLQQFYRKYRLRVQRQFCQTQRERVEFLQLQSNAVALQALSRGFLCRLFYVKLRRSLHLIKERSKLWYSMKNTAAISLQKWFRFRQCQSNYVKCRKSATLLQSTWRSRNQNQLYLKLLRGIISVQVLIKKKYQDRSKCVRLIQRNWRKSYNQSLKLQTQSKRYQLSNRQNEKQIHVAVVLVQKNWRSYCTRFNLLIKIISVTILQSGYRRYRQQKVYKNKLLKMLEQKILLRKASPCWTQKSASIKILQQQMLQKNASGVIVSPAYAQLGIIQCQPSLPSVASGEAMYTSLGQLWLEDIVIGFQPAKTASVFVHYQREKKYQLQCMIINMKIKQQQMLQRNAPQILVAPSFPQLGFTQCQLGQPSVAAEEAMHESLGQPLLENIVIGLQRMTAANVFVLWQRGNKWQLQCMIINMKIAQQQILQRNVSGVVDAPSFPPLLSTIEFQLDQAPVVTREAMQTSLDQLLHEDIVKGLQRVTRVSSFVHWQIRNRCHFQHVNKSIKLLQQQMLQRNVSHLLIAPPSPPQLNVIEFQLGSPSMASGKAIHEQYGQLWLDAIVKGFQRMTGISVLQTENKCQVCQSMIINTKISQQQILQREASGVLHASYSPPQLSDIECQLGPAPVVLREAMHTSLDQLLLEDIVRLQRMTRVSSFVHCQGRNRCHFQIMNQRIKLVQQQALQRNDPSLSVALFPPCQLSVIEYQPGISSVVPGEAIRERLGQLWLDAMVKGLRRITRYSSHVKWLRSNTCQLLCMDSIVEGNQLSTYEATLHLMNLEDFLKKLSRRLYLGGSLVYTLQLALSQLLQGWMENQQFLEGIPSDVYQKYLCGVIWSSGLVIMQRTKRFATVKMVIVVSFGCFAVFARHAGSPTLAFSFWTLGISALAQGYQTMHERMEGAAIIIQTIWRCYSIKKQYLQEENQCIVLQRAVRDWRVRRRIKATIILQRFLRRRTSVSIVSLQTDAETCFLILRGQMMMVKRIVSRSSFLVFFIAVAHAHASSEFTCRLISFLQLALFSLAIEHIRGQWVAMLSRRGDMLKTAQRALIHSKQLRFRQIYPESMLVQLREAVLLDLQRNNGLVESEENALVAIYTEFYREETAASRIISWWKSCMESTRRRVHFKSSRAATVLQSVWRAHRALRLYVVNKKMQEYQLMKNALIRRVQVLSAVVLQRWYRATNEKTKSQYLQELTMSEYAASCIALRWRHYQNVRRVKAASCIARPWRHYQKVRRSKAASCIARQWRYIEAVRQERLRKDAALCISQWWLERLESRDVASEKEVALAIREYCENRKATRQALATENQILYGFSNQDSSASDVMDLVNYQVVSANADIVSSGTTSYMACFCLDGAILDE